MWRVRSRRKECRLRKFIPYVAHYDESTLLTEDDQLIQIVKLEGSTWTNVSTVPDPVAGNPYVSTSISSAGTYALIQKP